MATVEELFEGRSEVATDRLGVKPSAEIPYVVKQATSESDVKAAAFAAVPAIYAGMRRKTIEISERVNETTWKVIANFEKDDFEEEEEPQSVFNFDTGGGTQHITQSISTSGKYGPQASDILGGAIGYDGDNVAGVDITVPVYNFSETHYLPDSVVTNAYKGLLFRKTGKINSDGFRGFAAGEVLFLGASGTRRGEEDWEITFKFAASPNRNGIQVGEIGGISKKGWEYLWVQYADDVDDDKKQIVKKPVAAYVEKVYEETGFGSMGIGA